VALLKNILSQLRKQERQLARQLEGIRSAISSLEFGGAASPPVAPSARGQKSSRKTAPGKRRKFSAATRAKMAAAQKARWAKLKSARNK
jgi:hypothetical protein